jgi:hypothetical protein
VLGLLLLGGAHSTPDITGSAHQVRRFGVREGGALQRKSYLCIPKKEIGRPQIGVRGPML